VDPDDRARRPDDHAPPDRFAVLARAAARECEEETGLRLAPRGLQPFARWVTPEHEPRRYDTTFLVTAVPPGATAAPAVGDPAAEVHDHGWTPPARLLAEVVAGERAALPPTRAVLRALADGLDAASAPVPSAAPGSSEEALDLAARVAAAVVARGSLVPVVPRAAWHDGPPAEDGLPDVDLLLPRHAGEVP
jgi:8-oxo-dGTP pyrophosphatase MutT (NUDIX family)